MNEPKPLPNPSETKLVETPRTDEVVRIAEELGSGFPATQADYNALAEHARQLERELASLADELRLAREALSHILWIKDCGIDGTDETGTFRNWPETERDKMYEIAKAALKDAASSGPKD